MKTFSIPASILLLFFSFLTISGCAGQKGEPSQAGLTKGTPGERFQKTWWNFYERGRAFADRKSYTEAVKDFAKAIEGRIEDAWHVQTSDMHFMDYFPHRELGVVYFYRRQYDEAISELEKSVNAAPSAKASYFLDQARAAKIRRESSDMYPPKLDLAGTLGKRITSAFTYMIKGVAEDDMYVASIQVGDSPIPIEQASKQRVFEVEIPLREGENNIPVTVTDLAGKTTETTLEVLCDLSGPLVEIVQVEDEGGNRVVQGVVSDEGGLKSLTVNGEPWQISGAYNAYNFKFVLTPKGTELVATDHAGNTTTAQLQEEDPTKDPLLSFQQIAPPEENPSPGDTTGQSSGVHSLPPSNEPDTDPPVINFTDSTPPQETYDDHLLLEGMVEDSSPLQSLTIDGEPVPSKNGIKLFFSKQIQLNEGNNEVSIVATDVHGNKKEQIIGISRKVQNIRKLSSRMTVAVLPFDHPNASSPVSELVHGQMIQSLVEQKRFNIIPREKLVTSLPELNLSNIGPNDPDQAVRVGKAVTADAVLAGTLVESPDSVEIIGRLIDTETATILASNDVFAEDKNTDSLQHLIDGLATKFKHDFPIVEGIVTKINGDEVVSDIGSQKRIRPNLNLICYREGLDIKHPVTGRIIDAEPQIIADLKVRDVSDKASTAVISKKNGEVMLFDRVISR